MQSKAREKGNFFSYVTIEGNEKVKRNISVVSLEKAPYFYCSSGTNSASKGTWFPCYGINEGWIIKPPQVSYPDNFSVFIRNMFLSKQVSFPIVERDQKECTNEAQVIEKKLQAFALRFGNIESLLFSYAVGGGYWDTKDSLVLRNYLDAVYAKELQAIKNNCPEISMLRNPPAAIKDREFFADFDNNPIVALSTSMQLHTTLKEQRNHIENPFALKIKRNDINTKPPLLPKTAKSSLLSHSMFCRPENKVVENHAPQNREVVSKNSTPRSQKDLTYALDDYLAFEWAADKNCVATLSMRKEAASCLLKWLKGGEIMLTHDQINALDEKSVLGDIFEDIKRSDFYKNNSEKLHMESTSCSLR
ncbi:hypothetical protein LEAN103870_19550 [Legionella anisa]|uniref:Uncharacterized protein n=1 Tax=Legionella anisa TaxID=28082 RepID=A0AAX0WX36_9GAMM|nr:hypothetical protein [Legionella anisa]AWN73483.1 hypothetical protein DLD14_06300 [Legionella anisa]KTC70787.1 hypothetical protein Lani_2334 [Legionella anisa]MBN5937548.1 hypothetical protein [Legionella anisa]MCW8426357.1 hypothetical protein [Legionella anisa]MCW8448017.1 hypothetical protein [Legionella anisa]